jgi:hypothetical protein
VGVIKHTKLYSFFYAQKAERCIFVWSRRKKKLVKKVGALMQIIANTILIRHLDIVS